MSERAEGDEVYPRLGVWNHGVERDAATRFGFAASVDLFYGLAGLLGREVIEHDAVASLSQCLVQLLEIANLTLYLQVLSMLFAVLLGTRDGVANSPRKSRCGCL